MMKGSNTTSKSARASDAEQALVSGYERKRINRECAE
jgi:hypothetical protein